MYHHIVCLTILVLSTTTIQISSAFVVSGHDRYRTILPIEQPQPQPHRRRLQQRRAWSHVYSSTKDDDNSNNNENTTESDGTKKVINYYYNDFDDLYDDNVASSSIVAGSNLSSSSSSGTKSNINDQTTTSSTTTSTTPSSTSTTPTSTTSSIWEQLKVRQLMIQREYQQQQKETIMSGKGIVTRIACAIPNDWIRHCSIHTYPYTMIGSASDEIYLVNIETGDILTSSHTIKNKQRKLDETKTSTTQRRLQYVLTQLFGTQQEYDGGGTLALGIYHTLLFEATRYGNVNIYQYATSVDRKIELSYIGNFPSLQNQFVTSIYCSDDDLLWIGTDVGRIEVYQMIQQDDDANQWYVNRNKSPYRTFYAGGSTNRSNNNSVILSLHVDIDLQCAVVTTSTGTVDLFYYGGRNEIQCTNTIDSVATPSTIPTTTPIGTFTLPTDDNDDTMERRSYYKVIYPTCATIVKIPSAPPVVSTIATIDHDTAASPVSYVIVCGTNNGNLYIQPLRTTTSTTKSTLSNVSNETTTTRRRRTVIDMDQPWTREATTKATTIKKVQPSHIGWVKCITSMEPHEGLLLTGALDGSIRVWDMNITTSSSPSTTATTTKEIAATTSETATVSKTTDSTDSVVQLPKIPNMYLIYQLMGYKIWLSNVLWCNNNRNNRNKKNDDNTDEDAVDDTKFGQRIVSDGADNTIIVHDFSRALSKIRNRYI